MRHTSIRFIRWLLVGIIILVFLLILGNYLYTRFGKSDSETEDLRILDSELLQSVERFEYSDSRDGQLRFKIRANRLLEESPGKVYLQGIEAFDFYPDGSARNEIQSRYAEYDRENRTVNFIEDVRLFLGQDLELRTKTLHYDMNADIGTTEDPVQFYSEKISGKARGLHYRLSNRLLQLKSDVDFQISLEKALLDGTDANEEIHALSDKAICYDNGARIRFQGHARLQSETSLLEGDTIQLFVDKELNEITSISSVGNALYRSGQSGESRILRGDRMVFTIHPASRNLEKIQVRGNAVFNSVSTSEERNLRGAAIDLFFDPELDALQKLNSSTGVRLRMKRGAEETIISGERFNAVFNPESMGLNTIDVRQQAKINMKGPSGQAGNEIRADRINIKFREQAGPVALDTLRAQGSARWTTLPERKGEAGGEASAGRLDADVIQMIYAKEGRFLDRINASGNVVMTEIAGDSENNPNITKISTDQARFDFYPERNEPKDMVAVGNVQVVHEGESKSGSPEKPVNFRTASDRMTARFAPDAEGLRLASASQKGNFKYEDATASATAGKCDYDAQGDTMTLSDSPKIYLEAGYSTGETAVVNLGQSVIRIVRNVRSVLTGMDKQGLLGESPSGTRSIILADNVRFMTEKSHARYTGNVQLLSEDQQLQADMLDILDGGDTVEADGNVRHRIYRRPSSPAGEEHKGNARTAVLKVDGNSTELPINIESSSFKYLKDKKTFTYSGNTSLKSTDLELASGTLEALLDSSGNDIEWAIARQDVVVFKTKWECTGDTAYYFRDPERIEVVGEPAVCTDPDGVSPSAPQLTYIVADDRILLRER